MRIAQGTNATFSHAAGILHVKLVQPVIEIEKVIHEVGANPKVERVRVRITCGREFSST